MGFHGNLKKLWRQLDANRNGFISLNEVDPEVGYAVGTFKLALMKKYGDLLTAWKQCLDVNNSGRIEEHEIATALRDLGLDLNAKKLYSYLHNSHAGQGLPLSDFCPDSYKRQITGDVKGLTLGANKEFIEDLPGIGREISMPLDLQRSTEGEARQFRKDQALADQQEVAEAVSE